MIIKSHKLLAEQIAGKRILHLNSLGKDSLVCLHWLNEYAAPSQVVSVFYEFLAAHPDDERYLRWQKLRYPNTQFVKHDNPHEISHICIGRFQSPLDVMMEFNHWEYIQFLMEEYSEELRKKYECDYICIGMSKYESVSRAVNFYKKGLCYDNKIFPIGLMTKAEVLGVIAQAKLKVHPCYKLCQGTIDRPSYYKMRSTFIAKPDYYKRVKALYPLITLDKYRCEVLFK